MRDGMITEEQCGENFAYILEDKTDFLITEYKMMHGQEADFLLKCVKMLYNGKTELYYDTKSCLPLAIQSGAEDTEGMLSVLGNILHEVRRVTENGFLSLLKDHIDHLGVRRSRENECCIRLVSLSGT